MITIEEFAADFSEDAGYLNFARLGPIGRSVVEEQRMFSEVLSTARFGSFDPMMAQQDERVLTAVSALTGFADEQIVFQPNTSMGLVHTLFGLSGTVALSPAEFPSVRYAAVRAQQALDRLDALWLEPEHGRVTPGTLREQLTPEVTAVAVSLVDFRTGFVADLEGIRQVIGDRLFIVDAIQGFGVVDAPYEVADVVVAGGQKWVRAGLGTGFLALSDRAAAHIEPLFSGWMADGPMLEAGVVGEAPRTAAGFRVSNPDFVAQARFAAALEHIDAVGVDELQRCIAGKVDEMLALLDEFGLPVVSPRDERERAGIVVVQPTPEHVTVLAAALHNHGVSLTQRDGQLRLSVHASTGAESFELLRGALRDFASAAAR